MVDAGDIYLRQKINETGEIGNASGYPKDLQNHVKYLEEVIKHYNERKIVSGGWELSGFWRKKKLYPQKNIKDDLMMTINQIEAKVKNGLEYTDISDKVKDFCGKVLTQLSLCKEAISKKQAQVIFKELKDLNNLVLTSDYKVHVLNKK